jgi:LEA14-like dessication related protein
MQRQAVRFVLGIVLITTVISCGNVEEPRIVELVDTQIKTFSSNSLEVVVTLKIENPNNFNIFLTGSELNISLNNKHIGTASIVEKVRIPKNVTEDQTITLKMEDTSLLAKVFPTLLVASLTGSFKLDAKGFIKARARGITKTVPIEFSQGP